jgi:hypothetical protein
MAQRGAKPAPVKLRLVTGAHRTARHGDTKKAEQAVAAAEKAFGKGLVPPKSFKGEALAAWRRYIVPAAWLDASREAAAIAFCELWAEFRFCPTGFPASKHGQLRAYMSELGLTDERNRGEQEDEEKDEFFDR